MWIIKNFKHLHFFSYLYIFSQINIFFILIVKLWMCCYYLVRKFLYKFILFYYFYLFFNTRKFLLEGNFYKNSTERNELNYFLMALDDIYNVIFLSKKSNLQTYENGRKIVYYKFLTIANYVFPKSWKKKQYFRQISIVSNFLKYVLYYKTV